MKPIFLAPAFLLLPVIPLAVGILAFAAVWSRRPRQFTPAEQFAVDWAAARFTAQLRECFRDAPAEVVRLDDRRRRRAA